MNFLSTKRRSSFGFRGPSKPGYFSVDSNYFDPQYQFDQGNVSPLEDVAHQLVRLNNQNEQLVAFTEHMCRQIRSVTGNLGLTVELLQASTEEQEQKELTRQIGEISASMNQMVDQLNQMTYCAKLTPDQKEMVSIGGALNKTLGQLNALIHESEAEVFSDFSEVPEVLFNTRLLESLFKSVIEHSIIHTPENRKPAIDIFSYQEEEHNVLLIKDNSDGRMADKFTRAASGTVKASDTDTSTLAFNALKLQVQQLGGTINVSANSSIGASLKLIF